MVKATSRYQKVSLHLIFGFGFYNIYYTGSSPSKIRNFVILPLDFNKTLSTMLNAYWQVLIYSRRMGVAAVFQFFFQWQIILHDILQVSVLVLTYFSFIDLVINQQTIINLTD